MSLRFGRMGILGVGLTLSGGFLACGSTGDARPPVSTDPVADGDAGSAPAEDASGSSDAAVTPDAAKPASDAGFDPAAPHLLAVGSLHSCAVRPGGTVKCWGESKSGQLGPAGNGSPATTPLDVGLADVVEVAAGNAHSCARLANGHVKCWGEGIGGQLGDGLKANSKTPVEVSGLTDAVSLTSDWAHTCALRANGHVTCWGGGGRIGDGTATVMYAPAEPPGITNVTSVAAGWGHTCILVGGAGKCWGTYNAWGQLGDGDTKDRLSPVDVVSLAGATSIVSGSYHVCALLADKTMKCWGNAQSGQIGTGVQGDAPHPTAEAVPNLTDVVQIGAKGASTCALKSTGEVYCWGSLPIGDGTMDTKKSPTRVTALGQLTVELGTGDNHHCMRLSTGEIKCWGNNTYRQLGDGTTDARYAPVTVQGL